MTSNIDIYEILTSKPHNPHYIDRYINFLTDCLDANESLDPDHYVECHHILPKAIDMFPGYADLNVHSWNGIYLTARQHFTAHLILWRAYPNIASQCAAIHYMCNVQNSDKCSISGRVIPQAFKNRYAAKAREEFFANRKGFTTYVDDIGERYFLHKDDPKIVELNLHGIMFGTTFTDEHRGKMRATKALNKKVTLFFLDITIRVKLLSERFVELTSQGWVTHRLEEDYVYIKQRQYEKNSASLKGRTDYMLPDGTFYGKLYADDPAISQLGLMYYRTEARTQSAINAAKHAAEFNTGSSWYNNGIESQKFKEHPGEPWVPGVLYKDAEAVRKARTDGVTKAIKGKLTYNNGIENGFFAIDDVIPEGWTKGMKPQKKRNSSVYAGSKVYNDGINNYRIMKGDYVDLSWKRGMVKHNK